MSYGKHVVLGDFILAVWWRPARERRPTCKFPTFIFLNFPYSLRTYSLPAPQGCQSAQTLHYITLHYITLHYITLHYHGILQLALYRAIDAYISSWSVLFGAEGRIVNAARWKPLKEKKAGSVVPADVACMHASYIYNTCQDTMHGQCPTYTRGFPCEGIAIYLMLAINYLRFNFVVLYGYCKNMCLPLIFVYT